MRRWKIAGVNFDHFHMGDLLRMVHDHPSAEIVGIADEHPERMEDAIKNFSIPRTCVFTDYRACLEHTKPDLVILCPATARHAEWVAKLAPFGAHLLIEKPFASSLAEADAMIAAMRSTGKQLAINWPMVWYPVHRTAKRLIDRGLVGEILEVHYYNGNRGPLWHVADKVERTAEDVAREKPNSWFYKKAQGGGSLQDYMGYGTTLGTWFLNGKKPIEVTCIVDQPAGLEVDEHAIAVARYETGLSKFETRWGTFSDPWTHQPQPKCGFVMVGTEGTIASYDNATHLRVQTRRRPEGDHVPVDDIAYVESNPIAWMLDRLERGILIDGPLSPELSRVGQQLVDSAVLSAQERRTVRLVGESS
jgi:glucose-fructose oxidoreductase